MNEEDKRQSDQAYEWVKKKENYMPIVHSLLAQESQSVDSPMAIFMAGSPGAGKTEFSTHLIKELKDKGSILQIDPDSIRMNLPMYESGRAHILQRAMSKVIDEIYAEVLKQRRIFLLDGTFAHEAKAIENVQRALNKSYTVHIFYVHQEPLVAWDFTKKREALEGRNIPKERFVDQYFDAPRVVNLVKRKFGDKVQANVVRRDTKSNMYAYEMNVKMVDIPSKYRYSKDQLIKTLV